MGGSSASSSANNPSLTNIQGPGGVFIQGGAGAESGRYAGFQAGVGYGVRNGITQPIQTGTGGGGGVGAGGAGGNVNLIGQAGSQVNGDINLQGATVNGLTGAQFTAAVDEINGIAAAESAASSRNIAQAYNLTTNAIETASHTGGVSILAPQTPDGVAGVGVPVTESNMMPLILAGIVILLGYLLFRGKT